MHQPAPQPPTTAGSPVDADRRCARCGDRRRRSGRPRRRDACAEIRRGVARAPRGVLPRPGPRQRAVPRLRPAHRRAGRVPVRARLRRPPGDHRGHEAAEHETVNFGGIWHSDTTYLDEPPMGTMLLSREIPPVGGDTMFANQYAAYEALSPAMQALLDPLRGITSSALADVSKTREDRIRDAGGAATTACTRRRTRSCARIPRPAQGPVRQRRPHRALRRDDRGGEQAAAAVPVPAPGEARVHVPVPLGASARSRCGTTAARSTTRSTTTTATSA